MKKVLLDLQLPDSKKAAQDYIAEQLGFAKDSCRNLDALYDELTSIGEPTAVGIFMPVGDLDELDIDLLVYFDKICEIFSDAEQDNPCLAVIFGDIMMNPEFEYDDDELIDEYTGEPLSTDDDEFTDEEFSDMPGDHDVIYLDLDRK